jgi:hypothetical protein
MFSTEQSNAERRLSDNKQYYSSQKIIIKHDSFQLPNEPSQHWVFLPCFTISVPVKLKMNLLNCINVLLFYRKEELKAEETKYVGKQYTTVHKYKVFMYNL